MIFTGWGPLCRSTPVLPLLRNQIGVILLQGPYDERPLVWVYCDLHLAPVVSLGAQRFSAPRSHGKLGIQNPAGLGRGLGQRIGSEGSAGLEPHRRSA